MKYMNLYSIVSLLQENGKQFSQQNQIFLRAAAVLELETREMW